MGLQALDIAALAGAIVRVDGLFDLRDERIALALYRLLAEGEPVSDERLAARAGRSVSEVGDGLRSGSRVELDGRPGGRVQGLSLRPTKHLFEVNGRTLYAWCAGDTLRIQDLLGRPARVRSTDPITGRTVSLSLEDGSVRDVEPSTAVLSMLRREPRSRCCGRRTWSRALFGSALAGDAADPHGDEGSDRRDHPTPRC